MKKVKSFLIDFFKLWFFMFFTYLTIKVIFNLIFFGWIDLRRVALLELLILPLGQSIAFWAITRIHKKKN